MALADIHDTVRTILYGTGLGEKASIRRGAADAAEGLAGDPIITFNLLADEGAKVAPGDVLSKYAQAAEDAHVLYVLSVSTDTVTAVNGGLIGAPAVTDGDLDNALLEQNPLITSHEIHQAIDTVLAMHLWPDVYQVETKTVASPDLVDGQEAVAADVEEIMSAWQRIGPTNHPVSFQRHPITVDTTLASTGKMAAFDWGMGGAGYYTAKTKITAADDDGTPELTRLIATGAAALAFGGTLVEATIENTKKDNAQAVSQRSQAGGLLWRDFLTLKQEYARELGRHNESRILIDRG